MPRIFTVSRGLARALTIALVFSVAAAISFGASVSPNAKAEGNACVAVCKSSHNQCRIATKGSASCDAQLQSCLQTCIKK